MVTFFGRPRFFGSGFAAGFFWASLVWALVAALLLTILTLLAALLVVLALLAILALFEILFAILARFAILALLALLAPLAVFPVGFLHFQARFFRVKPFIK